MAVVTDNNNYHHLVLKHKTWVFGIQACIYEWGNRASIHSNTVS